MLILGRVVVVLLVCDLDATVYLKLKQMQCLVERLESALSSYFYVASRNGTYFQLGNSIYIEND